MPETPLAENPPPAQGAAIIRAVAARRGVPAHRLYAPDMTDPIVAARRRRMSFDALAWAAKQRPGSSSRKLILLALAECASRGEAECWPSIDALCEFSALNRKTVINALRELEAGGYIADTGKRLGATRQIPVYRLSLESVPKAEQSQNRNSSVFSVKQSQNRDTEPVRNQSDNKPPFIPPKEKPAKGRRLPQDWEPDDDKVPDTLISRIVATIPDGHRGAWLDETLEAFRAYWLSKAGAGAVKLDWDLTWHNWLRKALNDVRPGRFAASQEAPRQYRHNGNGERERRSAYPSDKSGPREIGAALPLALSRRAGPAGAGG